PSRVLSSSGETTTSCRSGALGRPASGGPGKISTLPASEPCDQAGGRLHTVNPKASTAVAAERSGVQTKASEQARRPTMAATYQMKPRIAPVTAGHAATGRIEAGSHNAAIAVIASQPTRNR